MEKVNAYPENLEDGEKVKEKTREKVKEKTREKVKEKTREKENKQEKGKRRDKGPTLHPELQCELRVELLKEYLVQVRVHQVHQFHQVHNTREQNMNSTRSHSQGDASKNYPSRPTRVDIHGGHIFDNKSRKTLLGTIRNHWPEGVYQYRDISARYPNWLDDICDEFKNYYTHKKGQSSSEVDWSIELHVKNTCKRLISDEKDRFKNKKAKTGLSDEQLCPSYFHPNFWDGLLKFWSSDAHKHRAEVGSKNRQKVDTLHSAGAKAFEAHEMDIMEKNNGKKPPLLKVWERTHTTAASRRAREADATKPLVFTSPHAMEIAAIDQANRDYSTDDAAGSDENGSDDAGADDEGSDDAGEDGDVGGDNARNDYASDE